MIKKKVNIFKNKFQKKKKKEQNKFSQEKVLIFTRKKKIKNQAK